MKESIRFARVVGLDLVRDSRFMRMMAVPSGEDAGTLLHMDISSMSATDAVSSEITRFTTRTI